MVAHGPPQGDLRAAFIAAWGAPPPITRQVDHCCESGWDLEPRGLISLGGNRFALVVKESRERGAHASAGAVSVAYLSHSGRVWKLLGNWPEVAWAGESGGGNLVYEVRRDLGPRPLLLISGSHFGMGQLEDATRLVRLDRTHPVAVGSIPRAGSLAFDMYPTAKPYRYRSVIFPARTPGFLTVRYEGFTGEAGRPPRTPFRLSAEMVLDDGCVAARVPVRLPDTTWTGLDRADCDPAPSARPPRPAGTAARTGPGPGPSG